jgi:hypothetical protein
MENTPLSILASMSFPRIVSGNPFFSKTLDTRLRGYDVFGIYTDDFTLPSTCDLCISGVLTVPNSFDCPLDDYQVLNTGI